MREILRRDFLGASALGLPFFLGNPRPFLDAAMEESPRRVSETLGFVANPWVGGGSKPEEALRDAINMGGRWLSVLEPSEEFLKAFQRFRGSGLQLIPRLYLPENRFDKDHIIRELEKLRRHKVNQTVIQPYNEVNLPDIETGGKLILPFEHVNDHFIPTALEIKEYGGIPAFAPLAQGAEINDLEYYEDELKALVANSHFREIIDSIVQVVHHYIFEPGQELWGERLLVMRDLQIRYLGKPLDLHLTETGLYQVGKERFKEKVVAGELRRMINSKIPDSLSNLKSFCIWILACKAQEPSNNPNHRVADFFEPAALRHRRSEGGITEAYTVLQEEAKKAA